MRHPIAIVGGGLAGLVAARTLRQAGLEFALFEARNRLGGRILSVDASGNPAEDGFDLGPSWFWPAMQPGIRSLVAELGLPAFPQNSQGEIVFERSLAERPRRYGSMEQQPPSMRLAGGTAALIAALAATLPRESIHLGASVRHIERGRSDILVTWADAVGKERHFRAAHVILALPPRLLAATISFAPAVALTTVERWRETPTWMAPHAKFFALYDRPFWREKDLSGTAQSMVGPLVEIHDATTVCGAAALFGFLGIGAAQRASIPKDRLIDACLGQLARLFGPDAGTPHATLYKDWALDPLTATPADRIATGHVAAGPEEWAAGEWAGHIHLAGSETSATDPGYLSGAIEAARRATAEIVTRLAV